MDRNEVAEFIREEAVAFISGCEDIDGLMAEQLCALVTTYALVGGHDADTYAIDTLLMELWVILIDEHDDFEIPYDDFYNDMIKHIV